MGSIVSPVISLEGRPALDEVSKTPAVVARLCHVDEARRCADRIFGLREGRRVFIGPAVEVSDAMLVDILGECPSPLEPIRMHADRGPDGTCVVTGAMPGLLAGPTAPAPAHRSLVQRRR